MKYYAEIDETGRCFHTTQDELPLSDTILLVDEDVLGKIWDGEKWNEPEQEPLDPEPTQLDRIEAAVIASKEQIAQEAKDAYTLELIEGGVIQ